MSWKSLNERLSDPGFQTRQLNGIHHWIGLRALPEVVELVARVTWADLLARAEPVVNA